MGLLDNALRKLQEAAGTATEKSGDGKPWGGREPDKAGYGKAGAPTPDLDALVTDASPWATAPTPPRRNSRSTG